MSDQSRVFIGLLRPPKLMGLPIMYAMVWLFGSTLLFLWVQSWVVAVFAGLAWPALWKAADWDPNFLDVLVITLQAFVFMMLTIVYMSMAAESH